MGDFAASWLSKNRGWHEREFIIAFGHETAGAFEQRVVVRREHVGPGQGKEALVDRARLIVIVRNLAPDKISEAACAKVNLVLQREAHHVAR